MRGFAAAVGASVLLHVTALAWVTTTEHRGEPEHEHPRETPPITPGGEHAPPIDVVFLPAASSRGNGSQLAPRARAPAGSAPTAVTGSRGARPEVTGGETPGRPATGRSPYMTIRQGPQPVGGISGGFLDTFLSRSKPIPPPPDIPGERIGNEITNLQREMKRVDRYTPEQIMKMRGQLVVLYDARDAEELSAAGGGTYASEKRTFRAKINADGSAKLDDKPEELDSQDRMMLRHGTDPYARNKVAYLDRTRDQRVAIGKRHRSEELGKAVIYMQQHVHGLLASTTDDTTRKQQLFELWDECTERGSPEEVAAGEAARAFVLAHIRAKVRYTPDELRAMNARRQSTQVFAP